MAERRAAKRTKMILPVKIRMEASSTPIHTVDISNVGARVAGLREELRPGQVVSLSRGTKKAQFRAVWAQQLDKGEFQIGLEGIDLKDSFWGLDLEKELPADKGMDALMKLLKGSQKV